MNPLDRPVPDKLIDDLNKTARDQFIAFLDEVARLAESTGGWRSAYTKSVLRAWRLDCRQPHTALNYARFMWLCREKDIATLEDQWSGPPVLLGQGDYERLEGDVNPGAPVAYVLGIVVIVAVTVVVIWLL